MVTRLSVIGALWVSVSSLSVATASDEVITQQISQRLGHDPALATQRIGVSTQNGIVKLEGRVVTLDDAKRAVALAQSTVGVRSVWVDFGE